MRIRTVSGDLQVAVDTYHRAKDGRRITLVGMVHVADRRFFDRVQMLVAKRESAGAVVHYERIRPITDESATDAELALAVRLRKLGDHALLADLVGLQMQTRSLQYQRHWANTDMTVLQLLRTMPEPADWVAGMERAATSLDDMDDQQRRDAKRVVGWIVRHLPLVSRLTAWKRGGQGRRQARVLIDARNQVAIDAALTETREVVALWGAAHLPGIAAGLEREGFRRVSTKWLTAVRKPVSRHGKRKPQPVAVGDIGGWDSADGGGE